MGGRREFDRDEGRGLVDGGLGRGTTREQEE